VLQTAMEGKVEKNIDRYCSECQVGIPYFGSATYFTWIDDELITVPDFPCWICDVCGKRDWDTQALMQLNLLLSPNAGKIQSRRKPLPAAEPESKPAKTIRRKALR